ncbi:ribosome maturation factor RimM [Spirochaetia bacterium]|nr:ribosome maturation factor RimM [Spirochaetia bacterium]
MVEQFVVGLVGAPFGLKGFVKVKSLSGEIDHLLKLTSVTLRRGAVEQVREIEESAAVFPAVALKFKGINTPEDAKALGGAELIVGREQASPLKKGEYYIEDLRGIEVVLEIAVASEGSPRAEKPEILGHITDILEGGGGNLAEVKLLTGETRLVPFRDEFFGEINLETRKIALLNQWILE